MEITCLRFLMATELPCLIVVLYSRLKLEDFFQCWLCENQGEANGLANHIPRTGHIEKYLEIRFGITEKLSDKGENLLSCLAKTVL